MSFEKRTSPGELRALMSELDILRNQYVGTSWTATPNIKYTFFYSAHANRADFIDLEKFVQEADIVIPEVFGWEHNELVRLRQVAKGKSRALRQRPKMTDQQGRLVDEATVSYLYGDHETTDQILFNCRKQIFLVDVPMGHPDVELFHESQKASIFDISNFEDSDELLDHFTYAKAFEAKWHLLRERYMLEKLGEVISKIEAKEPKKVLIVLGALHTQLSTVLQDNGEDVRRHFTHSPLIFPLREEITRRFMFGKDVSRDLVAQAILEGVYALEINKEATNTDEATRIARQEFGSFTVEQFRKSFSGDEG